MNAVEIEEQVSALAELPFGYQHWNDRAALQSSDATLEEGHSYRQAVRAVSGGVCSGEGEWRYLSSCKVGRLPEMR
jgi:hypothetical protein